MYINIPNSDRAESQSVPVGRLGLEGDGLTRLQIPRACFAAA